MFSGIVAAIGRITLVTPREVGCRLTVDAGALPLADVALGDSIAHNGVCLTVVAKEGNSFMVDVSPETLSCTVGLAAPGPVNLEKALRASDRLGGHIVSGHVDGVGRVTRFEQVGESWNLAVLAPTSLAKYLAYKGSITVNGVSLTVNRVQDGPQGCEISINLIPHTVENTALGALHVDAPVNLEIDLIARYVERMLGPERSVTRKDTA